MADTQREEASGTDRPAEAEAEASSSSNGPSAAEASASSEANISSTASPQQQEQCAHCAKPAPVSDDDDDEHPLKPCAKCQTTRYCSRDCQKADFKKHKRVCAELAQAHARSGAQRPVQSAPRVPKQARRGGLQKWQFDT